MTETREHAQDPLLGRRELLTRASGGALGLALSLRLSGCAWGQGPRHAVHLGHYGARGDGRTDDTAAIQSAVNAARSGFTVLADRGRTYVVNGTITFPRDNVTFDLGGAAIRSGAAADSASIFTVTGRKGVRITNGRIASPLAHPSGGQMSGMIVLNQSHGCRVDHLLADCRGAAFANVYLGGGHRIEHNHVLRGSIGGLSCSGVLVKRNVLEASPNNALGFAGYRTAPANGNRYVENTIRDFGRIAIEDTSPDGSTYNYGNTIRGNTIYAPSPHATSGTAISAIGAAAVIEGNEIHDPTGYAIETTGLGTRVLHNRISYRRPPRRSSGAPAIIINSSTPGAPRPLIARNHIVNPLVGIGVYAGPYLGPIIVQQNVIENPAQTGIALASPGGTFRGPSCTANVVSFSVPAPSDIGTRIGIQTTASAELIGNRISYTRNTRSPRTTDVPIDFDGDNVVAQGNVIDGGGRPRGELVSRSLGNTWKGWRLSGNQFVGGASASVSTLAKPLLSGNVGPVTL